MRKGKNYFLILLTGVLLVAVGCHTTQKTVGNQAENLPANWTKKKMLRELKNQTIDFQTLSARLHIDYKDDKKQFNKVTTYIRMKKDSAIWLSVRPLLGIEMMRILITPDRIRLHNNLKNKTIDRSMKDVAEVLHIPFDFSILQSLIIGNMPGNSSKVKDIEMDSSGIHLSQEAGVFKGSYQWSVNPFLLQKSHYQLKKGTIYAEQKYRDYKTFPVGKVSLERHIEMKDSSKVEILLDFDKIKFNAPVSFPFP